MTSALGRQLLDHLLAGGLPSRLSVVGLCKNAGKTVALNHIVRAAADRNLPLGLISTGRDGEEQDAVTELPKPRIWAPAGALVATAQQALATGTARVEPLAELPLTTPFGRVVVGRVTEPGEVLLIGPGSASRIATMLEALEARGAQFALVDGSFDRIAAAAPAVTGRVVLAAGAAYSHSMAETVAQVRHVLDLFDLPPVAGHLASLVDQAAAPVCLAAGEAVRPVGVVSGLADPEPIITAIQAALAEGGATALILRGALSDRLLQALVRHRLFGLTLVVPDATHILVSGNLWRRWRSQGGQVLVRQPARLSAVTTNGYSPVGPDYDPQAFHAAVAEAARRPVFDLEAGFGPIAQTSAEGSR